MAKGSRPLPLPGLRGPHTRPYWPPTGQKRPPSLAPTGQLTAQRPPTGHLWPPPPSLATYGPLTVHPGRPRLATGRGEPSPGPPPTGQRDGRGSLWPHGSSSPPLPGHLWPKGSRTPHWPPTGHKGEAFAPPLTGHPGGPHWPQRDGRGTPSPGPPRLATYGSLSPTWPSEAFGHLHPHTGR